MLQITDQDFSIFDDLIKTRPEINLQKLKEDVKIYYLPYIEKLTALKKAQKTDQGLLVGVSAIQGIGKTTQGEILEVLLKHFGYTSISRSIDDHYLTHQELCALREKDPRFIRRGVTHDINLAISNLKSLQQMKAGDLVLVSGYDKGANHGDGERFAWVVPEESLTVKLRVMDEEIMINKKEERVKGLRILDASYQGKKISLPKNMGIDVAVIDSLLPKELCLFLSKIENSVVSISFKNNKVHFSGATEIEVEPGDLPNGWRLEEKKADFIFYDGWMLGARKVEDESVFSSGLPALEKSEDQEFAKMINKKLDDYQALWQMFGFLTVLYLPNYQKSLEWRDQAEEHLRAKGEGMNHDEIIDFVHYFWRSIHPAIHIKNLAMDEKNTKMVVVINDDHTVKEVLTPGQVKTKYS